MKGKVRKMRKSLHLLVKHLLAHRWSYILKERRSSSVALSTSKLNYLSFFGVCNELKQLLQPLAASFKLS